eukprot:1124286-Lingulodinium_polyedra.AAC.1
MRCPGRLQARCACPRKHAVMPEWPAFGLPFPARMAFGNIMGPKPPPPALPAAAVPSPWPPAPAPGWPQH